MQNELVLEILFRGKDILEVCCGGEELASAALAARH